MTAKLMAKKLGMTKRFAANGKIIPCTVLEVEKNVVTQIKTVEVDGYDAVQFGFEEIQAKDPRTVERRAGKPRMGLFKKNDIAPRRHLFELRTEKTDQYELGQEFGAEVFEEVKYVDVQADSRGKGFQGLMKMKGFAGGPAAHGSGFHRAQGSTGMRSTPGRCLPNSPRPSQMGNKRVSVQRLKVVEVTTVNVRGKDVQVLLVQGAVPGAPGAVVTVQESIKS